MSFTKPLLLFIVLIEFKTPVFSRRTSPEDYFSHETDVLPDQLSWLSNRRKSSEYSSYGTPRSGGRSLNKNPNIILVMTDDQDVELGSLNFMPKTLRILGEGGARFPNAYVTTPMCCPSRSSMLTGLYVHNHNVYTNNDNCSSSKWQQEHETRTFAAYLSNAGYRTAYFGKYLNEYNGNYIPPGWREWAGLIRNSRFYNYTINMNGKKIKHGDDYYQDYYPDLIANDSVAFLRQSKQFFSKKPVMLVMSFPSPHGPENAAPQHQHLFHNITTHRTPSWDYAPNKDKQWLLRYTGKMEPIHMKFTDVLHTKRLQTLQSVDDAIEKLYNELKYLGELENTYIFYTSDHGYHLGQFGLVKGKSQPFEFDVRVPFLVRGPFVPKGVRISDIVINVDLAPTFLELGGVEVPKHMDGKSIVPLLKDAYEQFSKSKEVSKEVRPKKGWRESFLIERGKLTKLYKDLDSLPTVKPMKKRQLIAGNCGKSEYSSPCKPYQTWECLHDGQRWRVRKCRNKKKKNCWCEDDDDGVFAEYISRALDTKQHLQSDIPSDFLGIEGKKAMKPQERRLQRKFLKEHVNQGFRPIFIGSRRKREILVSRPDEYFDINGVIGLSHWLDFTVKDSAQLQVNSSAGLVWFYDDDLGMGIPEYENSLDQNIEHKISVRSVSKLVQPSGYEATFHPHGCVALSNNSVICVDPVYYDKKSWRMNKNQLDVVIKGLKSKLYELKGLRRQLQKKRPPTGDESSGYFTQVKDYPVTSGRRCHCDDEEEQHSLKAWRTGQREARRVARQQKQEARLKKKEKKNRRKAKYKGFECNAAKMNCFTHDDKHWKTPPYWTYGPFCFCQNSNNNTYWCLRTINSTHNFLYCEFVTGFIIYFDLRSDPYQLRNAVYDLELFKLQDMRRQLNQLRRCKGAEECTIKSQLQDQERLEDHISSYSSRSSEIRRRQHKQEKDRLLLSSNKRTNLAN
ncbi:putative extracellular sulfatase Sulf-1 homolog isoform X2 [Limulus polyphemus]|uniref:Extracellular sulfatase Sulf-1 homolog isoform X2 n=1 Tax=Limulus polyphemus TaxID=6850 RepID=A0ABM1S6I9_LIMPO|nr:putative extracellular sulfatase Sulf-1 homolog isoform X2 [Limulus polyphemus]